MKRVLSLIFAVVLCLSLSVTVSANTSEPEPVEPAPTAGSGGGGLDIEEYNYLVEGFRMQDLLPAKDAIFAQFNLARSYGLWAWAVMFAIMIAVRIVYKFVSSLSHTRHEYGGSSMLGSDDSGRMNHKIRRLQK